MLQMIMPAGGAGSGDSSSLEVNEKVWNMFASLLLNDVAVYV